MNLSGSFVFSSSKNGGTLRVTAPLDTLVVMSAPMRVDAAPTGRPLLQALHRQRVRGEAHQQQQQQQQQQQVQGSHARCAGEAVHWGDAQPLQALAIHRAGRRQPQSHVAVHSTSTWGAESRLAELFDVLIRLEVPRLNLNTLHKPGVASQPRPAPPSK